MNETRKCYVCRIEMVLEGNYTVNKKGKYLKICNICRVKTKESRDAKRCRHGKMKGYCLVCGGSQICEHCKIRYTCTQCGGSMVCTHGHGKNVCPECDPDGYLTHILVVRATPVLKPVGKTRECMRYIGCDVQTLRKYIEKQFKPGQTWQNYGKSWHIDHRLPLMYGNPTQAEKEARLYYTNLQPMWAKENLVKGNRYIQ